MPVLLLNVCEENLEFILSDCSMVHAFFFIFYYVPNIIRFPTGFFVCKLQKISNATTKQDDGEEEETPGEIDESFKAHLIEDEAPVRSRKRAKKAAQKEVETSKVVEKQEEEPKPKKKRIRGIVKKAKAELLAEMEAKRKAAEETLPPQEKDRQELRATKKKIKKPKSKKKSK